MTDGKPGILVNGEARRFVAGSVAELLRRLGCAETTALAVAVNGEVVPRADWERRRLAAGDAVEIVGAVQGG